MPVERLEPRRFLDAVTLGGTGVLTITGDTLADTINVYQTSSGVSVDLDGNGFGSPYANGSISRIDIFGLDGADEIYVEGAVRGWNYGGEDVAEVVKIEGGDGNDIIIAGDSLDTVYGGNGNDSMQGSEENDLMYGGAGNDTMGGDADNDTMYGGYGGEDVMSGGTENDLMYGGDAGAGGNVEVERDTLNGEDGNDTLYAEGGNDSLNPGNGEDFAYGGDGNDTFRGSLDNMTDWLDGGAGTDDVGTQGTHYDSPGDSLFNFP